MRNKSILYYLINEPKILRYIFSLIENMNPFWAKTL